MVIFMIFATAILIVPAVLLRGWIIQKMWLWFIVPQFHQQPLPLQIAVGISLIVEFLTHQDNDCLEKDRDPWEKLGLLMSKLFLTPLLIFAVAWLYTKLL